MWGKGEIDVWLEKQTPLLLTSISENLVGIFLYDELETVSPYQSANQFGMQNRQTSS